MERIKRYLITRFTTLILVCYQITLQNVAEHNGNIKWNAFLPQITVDPRREKWINTQACVGTQSIFCKCCFVNWYPAHAPTTITFNYFNQEFAVMKAAPSTSKDRPPSFKVRKRAWTINWDLSGDSSPHFSLMPCNWLLLYNWQWKVTL